MRGDTPLWPQEPHARASIDRWMDAQQTLLNRPDGCGVLGPGSHAARKARYGGHRAGEEDAARAWGLLESSLTRFPYIAGNAFTLADIVWGPHVHRWFVMPVERPDMPYLRAWYERLLQRPAYVAHCAGPLS